jgi:hypothetical protein
MSGREGEEVGVNSLHAEVAHGSQRNAEKWGAVAGNRGPARLTVKTVADTFLFLNRLDKLLPKRLISPS